MKKYLALAPLALLLAGCDNSQPANPSPPSQPVPTDDIDECPRRDGAPCK